MTASLQTNRQTLTTPWHLGGISPAWGCVFVLVYVALDWISYINLAGQFPITPWNPFTGLAFALAIINGPRFAIWWVFGLCAADILVRGASFPFITEALVSVSIATTYCLGAWFLSAPKLGFSNQLATWKSVASLVAVGALCTIVASVISVAVLTAMDSLNTGDATRALIRHFVGDMIGILVITPFVLIRDQLARLASKLTLEHALIAISTMSIIWLVTIFDGRVRLYLLFLPVIWCAVRFGLPGAVANVMNIEAALAQLSRAPAKAPDLSLQKFWELLAAKPGILIAGAIAIATLVFVLVTRGKKSKS